ncbi:MAG: hypothetical protein H6747_07360, partial [Deltaproteobacteria bacterium]|nr:hypothetical protein [Deltaproteobacteria bacterium]
LAAQDGATRGEIAFARDYLRGSQRQSTETAPEILATQLRARALGLPDDWIAGFEARLAKVDSKAVRTAMAVLAPKDVCVVVVGDAAKLRPQLEALGSGFAVEVIPRGGLPEATKMPGKPPSPTPARPQVAPEADEETGPEFDEKGEVVDAPAPITPTAADDDADDDPDGDDGDGGNSGDGEADDDGDAMRSGAAS